MNILYVGDVMGEAGIKLLERLLPGLRHEHAVDVVIAQAENVTDGKALSTADYQRLRKAGVDGFSGGNHSVYRKETLEMIANPEMPVVGPANMTDSPGPGFKIIDVKGKRVLLVSLLGQIVGRDAHKIVDNPLLTIDRILSEQSADAVVVNFHGDFSSEKVVIGHYLDGRVSVVVGDHWHVPTADARVLPGGTAHMSDVGMCGVLNSSLGVEYASIVTRWRDGTPTKNVLATNPPYQFNALLVSVNNDGLAESVQPIQKILD
jgi:metallophosphoesterase (TIGR00282 family)